MELSVVKPGVGDSGTVSVSEETFARDYNESLVHQVVTSFLAGARQGTRAQKNRAAVAGGGRKPWRQKGTGRARAGTIRSPIWRSGGVTFAAAPQDHSQKVNKKMYRGAMRSIVAELVRQERLTVADLNIDSAKTKLAVDKLAELGLRKGLILLAEGSENLEMAVRNIPHISVAFASDVDPVALVGADMVVASVDAVRQLEERLK